MIVESNSTVNRVVFQNGSETFYIMSGGNEETAVDYGTVLCSCYSVSIL